MDLLQRFTHGEIDAFETLVRQFQGEIYAWTVRIVRDPGVAEDLTVETLWRVYRARQKFRPNGNFGACGHGGSLPTWRSTISGETGESRVSWPSLQKQRGLILWCGAKPTKGSSRHFGVCRPSCRWRQHSLWSRNCLTTKLPTRWEHQWVR